MKWNFTKTIQGHQLEFNKQTSAGYQVYPKNAECKSFLLFYKDDGGMWNISETENLPAWFNEISMEIHFAIEENEAKENSKSAHSQLSYLF